MTQPEPRKPASLFGTFLSVEGRDFSIKWVFDHFKGYAMCGLLFWAAIDALWKHEIMWLSPTSVGFALGASALLAIALVLYGLNAIHGVVWFAKSFPGLGAKAFTAIYLLVVLAAPVVAFSRH